MKRTTMTGGPLLAGLMMVAATAACRGAVPQAPSAAPAEASQPAQHNHIGHGDEVLYGCPMHKEMVGSAGDRCPLCNYMEMVPVTWSLDGVETVRVQSLPDYAPPTE